MQHGARSLIAVASLVAAAGVGAQAGAVGAGSGRSPDAGRLLAAGCTGCHGTDGRSQAGGLSLAGLNEAYISAQMQDFKSGRRSATVMHQLAKGYGDADIAALARYFAAQSR